MSCRFHFCAAEELVGQLAQHQVFLESGQRFQLLFLGECEDGERIELEVAVDVERVAELESGSDVRGALLGLAGGQLDDLVA
jgi:hypothetical protein